MKSAWKVLWLIPISTVVFGISGCDSVLQALGLQIEETVAESEGSDTASGLVGTQSLIVQGNSNILENQTTGIELTLPDTWSEASGLHGSAELQAEDTEQDLYLIVVAEADESLRQFTLRDNAERYRDLLISRLQTNGEFDSEIPTNLSFLGDERHFANQAEIRGVLGDGTPIVYLHTTVVTETRHYQIVAWTTPEQYATYESELQGIIRTFSES